MSCKLRWATALGLASALAACANVPPAPTGQFSPIGLTEFVNSLKCEYASYISEYSGNHIDLRKWPISGTMNLNVAVGNAATGSATGIVPFQGANVGFGLSASVARKFTTLTTIKFEMEPGAPNSGICDELGNVVVKGGIGFGNWLWGVSGDLDRAAEGPPRFGVSGLSYQLVFAVERVKKGDVNVGLSIIPLTVSASALASRNDVQTITIDLQPPTVVVGTDSNGRSIKRPIIKQFNTPLPVVPMLSPMLVPG